MIGETRPRRLLCVAGVGTDVGKTTITAGLLRACERRGIAAQALKAVQTGAGAVAPDAAVYADAAPTAGAHTLMRFPCPCSPHLAAALAGAALTAEELTRRILTKAGSFAEGGGALTLVEGAGGLLVPLNRRECFIEVFRRLDAPVLLVADNALGAINHALLSLEALRARGLKTAGLALTSTAPRADEAEVQRRIAEDNAGIIAALGGVSVSVTIPWLLGLHEANAQARRRAWDALADALTPLLDAALEGMG
jgi:adenosylmethionine-8-amino-7-oxononanoate aminotransferase